MRYWVHSIGCRLGVIWFVTAKSLYLLQLLSGAIHLELLTNMIKVLQVNEVRTVYIHVSQVPLYKFLYS